MRRFFKGSMSLVVLAQFVEPIKLCLLLIGSFSTTNSFIHAPLYQRHRVGKVSSSYTFSPRRLSEKEFGSTAATSSRDFDYSPLFQRPDNVIGRKQISRLSALISKVGMMAFIISMCLTLPFALIPPNLLHRLGLISKTRQQQMALSNGQFCARWLLRIFPFCKVTTICPSQHDDDPQPSIWVCNHTSALDVFILLAKDLELRGKNKRPIKVVYVRKLRGRKPMTVDMGHFSVSMYNLTIVSTYVHVSVAVRLRPGH